MAATELLHCARPFVYRALRGPRRVRTLAIAFLAGLLSFLVGLWLAQGDGEFEHDVRVLVGAEAPTWEVERTRALLLVFTDREAEELAAGRAAAAEGLAVGEPPGPPATAYLFRIYEAALTVHTAAHTPLPPDMRTENGKGVQGSATMEHLAARAKEIDARWHRSGLAEYLGTDAVAVSGAGGMGFDWNAPEERARLSALLEADGLPRVRRYRSPLGFQGTVGVIGYVAGVLVFAVGTFWIPFAAGSAVAQEVHAGTMEPLVGTGMPPLQIAVGLLAGAAVRPAVVAAPAAATALLAGTAVGGPLSTAAALGHLLLVTFSLAGIAVAVGQFLGRRVNTVAAAGMLSVTHGILALGGFLAGAATHARAETHASSVQILLPQMAASHLLHGAFFPVAAPAAPPLSPVVALGVQVAALAVFAGLSLVGFARTVSRHSVPALRPAAALLGAATVFGLTSLAILGVGYFSGSARLGEAHRALAPFYVPLSHLAAAPLYAVFGAAGLPRRRLGPDDRRWILGLGLAFAVLPALAHVAAGWFLAATPMPLHGFLSATVRATWVGIVLFLCAAIVTTRPVGTAGGLAMGLALLVAFFVGVEALTTAAQTTIGAMEAWAPLAPASRGLAVLEAATLLLVPALAWRALTRCPASFPDSAPLDAPHSPC